MTKPADLPRYDNPPAASRVRGLLCSDQNGQMQIIAPEHALVDPEPIRLSTARNLRSLPPSTDTSVCAIPGFYGLPSVVHSSLKSQDDLALATEIPGEYVRASSAQVHQLCQSHPSFEAEFCEKLRPTPISRSNDEIDILDAFDVFTARRIQARLDETLHIPPLPEAAGRIIALQQDPNFDLHNLVEIVETDPAISARILGWSNSALYASMTPVKTLNDAIMRVLGFDLVFNMALGMAIGTTLNLPKSHVSGASPYWLDAVYTAATMEALSQQIPQATQPSAGTSYLVGLLANFGTLVVGHVFPPQYENICRIQEANPQLNHCYVDQHVLSVNREVIAATLLELWELPDEITTAVRFQHVADYTGEHQTYVRLLTLTHSLLAGDEPSPENVAAAQALHIDEHKLAEVMSVLVESRQDLGDLARSLAP